MRVDFQGGRIFNEDIFVVRVDFWGELMFREDGFLVKNRRL